MRATLVLFLAGAASLIAAEYKGPRPPKPDIPYLLHANHLLETEISEARDQGGGKKETKYVIPGASSPAKTPLAEPIFIIETNQLAPDQIELYRLETKGGSREVVLSQKKHNPSGPFHMLVTRLAEHLYKIEVDEPLQNGEYSLSPNGSNRVFCFAIY